ncbi:MAG: hypothetical protein COA58_05410 [Bacteroidetes bacterium]|nr:MAG: hypothetical protein COA58_05410 [Bacteroidota bacterium]
MKAKYILTIITFQLLVLPCLGQNDFTFKLGPKIKTKNSIVEFIYADNSHVILRDEKVKSDRLVIYKNLVPTIKPLSLFYQEDGFAYNEKNFFHTKILTGVMKSKIENMEAAVINKKTFRDGTFNEINTGDYSEMKRHKYDFPVLKWSENDMRCAYHRPFYAKVDGIPQPEQIEISVLDENLELVWNVTSVDDLDLPLYFGIKKIAVSEKGEVAMLFIDKMRRGTASSSTSSREMGLINSEKPTLTKLVLLDENGTIVYSQDIEKLGAATSLKFDTTGNFQLAASIGRYTEEVYFLEYDFDKKEIVRSFSGKIDSDYEKQGFTEKGLKSIEDFRRTKNYGIDLTSINYEVLSDGSIIFFGERDRGYSIGEGYTLRYTAELCVFSLDSQGDFSWGLKIPKEATIYSGDRSFSHVTDQEGNIHFVFDYNTKYYDSESSKKCITSAILNTKEKKLNFETLLTYEKVDKRTFIECGYSGKSRNSNDLYLSIGGSGYHRLAKYSVD